MKPVRAEYPRRPAGSWTVFVDVDGTTMDLRPGFTGYPHRSSQRSLEVLEVCPVVRDRLQALERSGFTIRFLSGCQDTVRESRVQIMEAAGYRDVDARLENYPFRSEAQLRRDKADAIADHGAVLMIGDSRIDRQAAALEQVAFMHVAEFRRGASLDGFFCWTCGESRPSRWANSRVCAPCSRPMEATLMELVA